MSESAPLYNDLALGPVGGRAFWLRASDGVRLRAVHWPAPLAGSQRATVLIFPGRTEYAEKYGPAAAELAAKGYDSLVIDWRGQGLSDRLHPDRMLGHVAAFGDYQLDVQAMLAMVQVLGLPDPAYLLSHSMGGAIALRALINGLPIRATVFSAPMWGIAMLPGLRPIANTLAAMSRYTGQAFRYVPSTNPLGYVGTTPFRGNLLTKDAAMYAWMQSHLRSHPELGLGGPSMGWLHEGLTECSALAALPSPDIPARCALGTHERIVDVPPIHARMEAWPRGVLELYPQAEHEVLMETEPHRRRFYDSTCAHFAAHP